MCAKYATSSTYTDTTFGLITALGVIHSSSGYLVVLGKLLRGSSVTGSSTPGGSTPAADSALFDSFEFMGEHYKDRWLFLSRQALNWVPRLYYTGHRGSQDSTNASGGDIADIWTKREIGNFEHL